MEKFQMALRTSLILLLLFFIGCGDSNRATQSVLPTPVVTYTPGEVVSDLGGNIQYYVGNTPMFPMMVILCQHQYQTVQEKLKKLKTL